MNTRGFTLIEIIVVIVLVGIMSVVVVPYFGGRKQRTDLRLFTAQCNQLLQGAWRNALETRRIQKVTVNFIDNVITLAELIEKGATKDEDKWSPVRNLLMETRLAIPVGCTFVNFFIEGKDEMAQRGKRETVYFFIMPDGVAQSVIINLKLQSEDARAGVQIAGLVLNPFSAQFEYYDEWQKP